MLRQVRFMICAIGVLLIYQTDKGVLFYVAGMTAFSNLFSAQFMCGTQACQTPQPGSLNRNSVALFHYATTIAGAIFCLLGSVRLGLF